MVTSRKVGEDEVEIGRTSQRGVYGGAYKAYLGDRVPQAYQNSMRATEPSRFFVLGADCFAEIVRDWFPMAVHLLEGCSSAASGHARRSASGSGCSPSVR